MRLSNFIVENLDSILQEWEEFAATLVPARQKNDKVLLRDHLRQMLKVIVTDLERPQSKTEEMEKSKGRSDLANGDVTAATIHGLDRLALGFSLNDAMAEYRALRASVTRLWQQTLVDKPLPVTAMEDLIRFNEAIDQSISESINSYSFEKEQQTRVFDTILSSSPDLSFTFNLEGKFMYANKALIELLELPLDDIVGKNHFDLGVPDAENLQQEIQQVIATNKQYRSEMPYTSTNGKKEFYDYFLVPTHDREGIIEAVAGTARNVTARKAAEEKNWRKANYDLLTGLPNRRLFRDRLKENLKHAERTNEKIALLFIDLDRFKEANDSFGHDAGDTLLKLVAQRICACVRETDTVSRLGGDEFTVILQDFEDATHVESVTEKILTTLATPFNFSENVANISSSIGIAFFPQDAKKSDQLIKAADQAMYSAKAAGRNQFSLFSTMVSSNVVNAK